MNAFPSLPFFQLPHNRLGHRVEVVAFDVTASHEQQPACLVLDALDRPTCRLRVDHRIATATGQAYSQASCRICWLTRPPTVVPTESFASSALSYAAPRRLGRRSTRFSTHTRGYRANGPRSQPRPLDRRYCSINLRRLTFTREVAFALSVVDDRVTPKPVRNTGPWGY